VLYFLLCSCSNKELFPMLTSLNGTFAALVMHLPFFFFFFSDSESMLTASSYVGMSPRRHDVVPSDDFHTSVCLWKPSSNKSALYFNLDCTGCF
jgi:hypothetical protein